jgi:ADP-ribose pyrophosphatase YjhB (NUDIX family)
VRASTTPPKYALVRRSKPPGAGLWSLPGGGIDLGEGTMDAAKRELREETGLTHGTWHAHPFTTADVVNTDRDGRTEFHYVIAETFCSLESEVPLRAGDDAAEARWWSLADVERMEAALALSATASCTRVLRRAEALVEAGIL